MWQKNALKAVVSVGDSAALLFINLCAVFCFSSLVLSSLVVAFYFFAFLTSLPYSLHLLHLLAYSLAHLLTCLPAYLLTCLLAYLLTDLLAYLFTILTAL